MNAFGRVIAAILAAILIFLFPLQYLAINQEAVLDSHVHSETTQFANEIMLQGYLTEEMYTTYINELAATNQLYNIELVHSKPMEGYDIGSTNTSTTEEKLIQIYANTTNRIENRVLGASNITTVENIVKDISAADNTSIESTATESTATINIATENTATENNTTDNEGQDGFINLVSINRNEKATTVENSGRTNSSFQLTSAHVHTDTCYAGHRHTASCASTLCDCGGSGMIEFFDGTYYANTRTVAKYGYRCADCKKVIFYVQAVQGTQEYLVYSPTYGIYADYNAEYHTGNVAADDMYTTIRSRVMYNTTITSMTSNEFASAYSGVWWNTYGNAYSYYPVVDYYSHIVKNCGLTEDTTPICNQVVTSITPTNPIQTVMKGTNVIATATATYLDGHTETVACTNNYAGTIGTQTVTLTYLGLVYNAKTYGSITCTQTVTTKPNTIPVSLSVTPSSSTVFNGTEPSYIIKVNYDDNSSKTITTGYTKIGFTKGAGTKTVMFTYSEDGKTVTTEITILVKRNTNTCINGHIYELDDYDTDNGCPICEVNITSISVAPQYITVERESELPISVTATYLDGHTQLITSGLTSNFNSNQLGNQLVTITYKGKSAYVSVTVAENVTCPICNTVYQPSTEEPGCPTCSKKVVSITATPATQTILYSENITLEVIATYLDGHSAIVTDWTSNMNSFKVGTQTVTIYYQTITTNVTVIVESETEKICLICGTIYNPIEYPNGCPTCAKTVEHIEARLRNGGAQVQYGNELNLAVILIFKDGHREIAYNGWSVEGYQAEVIGVQTLTITYNEHHATITIEVVNSLSTKMCINGHVYYLNEDGSDPGCPYCSLDILSETSQGYFDCIYTETILEELYAKGIYYFEVGDYITVTVIPKNRTFFDKLQHLFYTAATAETKYSYGGMIGNESI